MKERVARRARSSPTQRAAAAEPHQRSAPNGGAPLPMVSSNAPASMAGLHSASHAAADVGSANTFSGNDRSTNQFTAVSTPRAAAEFVATA